MRLALLLSVALAAAASGQDSVPDPTPPHLYYPLAVGNAWEYANIGTLPTTAGWYTRREIVRDTVIGGVQYFAEAWSNIPLGGGGWQSGIERWLRYDSLSTQVYELMGDADEFPITCRFEADYGTPAHCEPEPDPHFPEGSVTVAGGVDAKIPIGRGPGRAGEGPTDSLDVAAVKAFYFLGTDYSTYSYYAAPIGYAGESQGFCSLCARNLTYALVHQPDGTAIEVGTQYAVASGERPDGASLTLTVSPTPTAGPLAVAISRAREPATVEVFDALGRRVWHADAVRQQVQIDASGWAPGLYVVRARTDRETTTTTVIRR